MLVEIMDNGQIALPPAFMDQLKWKIGDKLNILVENGELRLRGIKNPYFKIYPYSTKS